jgi:hypothetical protein
MSKPVDPAEVLSTFTGRAPIFPLPNVVALSAPTASAPCLRARYRRMVHDCLRRSSSRNGSSEAGLKPRPHFEGRVRHGLPRKDYRRTASSRRTLLSRAAGSLRARILEEEDPDQPYRIAKADFVPMFMPLRRRSIAMHAAKKCSTRSAACTRTSTSSACFRTRSPRLRLDGSHLRRAG